MLLNSGGTQYNILRLAKSSGWAGTIGVGELRKICLIIE
jgi:hypothetical protein